ncbi:endopeptidase [Hymenobacter sp. GOD-10R]|uniref:trypsin-like serine peptidase n=1 Tax=Hymenobacter sp. GOD-10R TaxID=3093922 RepID=UPI002D787BAA|nr:endopeptidase [Hymenobacter sp. GOD-10R]WRQ30116.1 endopeptidase [Hymenobacter sp. GOD-10R]
MDTLLQDKEPVTIPSVGKPMNGHTPVSNLSEEATQEAAQAPAGRALPSSPPAEGTNPQTIQPGKDGVEAVSGFKLRETQNLSEAALSKLYKAPDTSKLRDIGEASYGVRALKDDGTLPTKAETVHGPDDRVQITNTTIYPWRAIASLLITARDGSQWIGTGWFIGPHTLMTAGHVVFIKNSGVAGRDGWVRSIQVMPGRNGASLPYGSVTSTNFRSVTNWTNNGDENFDYGAIIIPTNLGNTTGWFGFGIYSDADLLNTVGNISGYPGDKPGGTQWFDARRIASVNSRKVYYDIDTAGGQSGSAVYRLVNGARYAFAIHAYGGATTNSGTRIVQDVYNNMVSWKA